MPYTGRPSAGCENCRRAKKACDQGQPACGRCLRLGKACGGYRNVADLMFRDQSASVARRASAAEGSSSSAASIVQTPSLDRDTAARAFFQKQFVSDTHLPFLRDSHTDDFLATSILANAYAGLSNLSGDESERSKSRTLYIDAISATNTALRHPRRVKEDSTLISVVLLGLFERLTWDGVDSVSSWKHHIQGATQVLQLRGRTQVRTKMGALLFREVRHHIITNSLWCEEQVPDFLVQWSQALDFDPLQTHTDQLVLLSARVAALRQQFRTREVQDQQLVDTASRLEADLLTWSEETLAAGSACSFYNVQDPDSPSAWNGTRHEYGMPQAYRSWNHWRCLRILTSRIQETVWRRSWPLLVQPSQPIQDAEYYRMIRSRMTADICVATAYAFGNDNNVEPTQGAIASGYLCILPLCLGGAALMEVLANPTETPGGTRAVFCDQPLHLDPFNQTSAQLAWIIARLDYIAGKVGIRWAKAISSFLKGDFKVYYDLGRSRVVKSTTAEGLLLSEQINIGSSTSRSDSDEPGPSTSSA